MQWVLCGTSLAVVQPLSALRLPHLLLKKSWMPLLCYHMITLGKNGMSYTKGNGQASTRLGEVFFLPTDTCTHSILQEFCGVPGSQYWMRHPRQIPIKGTGGRSMGRCSDATRSGPGAQLIEALYVDEYANKLLRHAHTYPKLPLQKSLCNGRLELVRFSAVQARNVEGQRPQYLLSHRIWSWRFISTYKN